MFQLLSDITIIKANWIDYWSNSVGDVTHQVAMETTANEVTELTWNWTLWPMSKLVLLLHNNDVIISQWEEPFHCIFQERIVYLKNLALLKLVQLKFDQRCKDTHYTKTEF